MRVFWICLVYWDGNLVCGFGFYICLINVKLRSVFLICRDKRLIDCYFNFFNVGVIEGR